MMSLLGFVILLVIVAGVVLTAILLKDTGKPRSGAANGARTSAGKKRWLVAVLCVLAAAALLVAIAILPKLWADSDANAEEELQATSLLVEDALHGIADSDGSIAEEDVGRAIDAVYEAGRANGDGYTFVEKNERSVVFGMRNGGAYVYLPPAPFGSSSADAMLPAPRAVASGVGGRIATAEPYFDEMHGNNPWVSDNVDRAAQDIADALTAYSFRSNGSASDDNYDNREASPEFARRLSDYSVVIWYGHGGYSEKYGSFLCTTVPYSAQYEQDYRSGRILVSQSGVCLTPAFFSYYLQENPHPETLIFLGGCSTGKDARLADAFLSKGFDCAIASSDTIGQHYLFRVIGAFFNGMSAAADGTFMTSGEAMRYMAGRCGAIDPFYRARPMLFGSPEVCFARVGDAVTPLPTASPTPDSTPDPTPTPTPTPSPTPDDGMRTVQGVVFEAAYGIGDVHVLTEDGEYVECTFNPKKIELIGEPVGLPGDRVELTYQKKNGGNIAIRVRFIERLKRKQIHGVFLRSGNGVLTMKRDDGTVEEMYTYSMTGYFPPMQNNMPATIEYVDVPGNRKLAMHVTYDD